VQVALRNKNFEKKTFQNVPEMFSKHYSVDIGASAKLELVDKFCYLGDMLSVDGDADAAVEARIRIGWNKFRQLVPLLTNKCDVSYDYEREVIEQLCAKQYVAWK